MIMGKQQIRTVCPMNCNPTHCGMIVEIEGVPPGVVWMRDGWVGLNRVTNGGPALPIDALPIVDPSMIPGGQAGFDARIEVRKE